MELRGEPQPKGSRPLPRGNVPIPTRLRVIVRLIAASAAFITYQVVPFTTKPNPNDATLVPTKPRRTVAEHRNGKILNAYTFRNITFVFRLIIARKYASKAHPVSGALFPRR